VVVERSRRTCLLCDTVFTGRAFLCRSCAEQYRAGPIPLDVRKRFYEALDEQYRDRSNTYGAYNEPAALLSVLEGAPRSARVLEIGAGGGFLAETLDQIGFDDLTLTDFTATATGELKRRLPDIPIVQADAAALPFKNETFDIVISSDVVEHIPDTDRHLSEVARVLDGHGLYLIKTPNRLIAEPYYRARGLYDYRFWHPSMFSPGELRRVLKRHGFQVRILDQPRLTRAQVEKLPGTLPLRELAQRLPLGWAPVFMRPHLEVVAKKRD
jgi:SAM-dependent methyltransferase